MKPIKLLAAVAALIAVALIAMPHKSSAQAEAPGPKVGQQVATFAGGCFWCMVGPFVEQPGVASVISGYTGGHVEHPSYEQVSSGDTGHAEAVQIIYDPKKISYEKLLDIYWHSVDPTTPRRQFCDSGDQYRTAIFYHGDEQKKLAEGSREALARSGVLKAPIVTEITAASTFYEAEDYHQDYFRKRDIQYQIYRRACGRDARLKQLYGDKAAPAH